MTNPLTIKTVVLDAGHGSINPKTGDRSEALTRVYKFPHNGNVVYEGKINRLYTAVIKQKLESLGFKVTETAPDYKDTSLAGRVAISNREDSKEAYFLSIHCNGSAAHNATGAEGFTTRGQNRSDDVMEAILQEMSKVTKIRPDRSDGDLDRESNFYVIKNTKLRSGLLEMGFYDNWDEYLKLTNPDFINELSQAVVDGIVNYNKKINSLI